MYQIQSEYLFPTQVVTGQLPNFKNIQQPLVDWIYDYKERNNDIARISNKGGWQSESKEVFTDEGFKPFERAIISCVNELCMEFRLVQSLRLMQMWINVNGPNSYNVSHRHPGCILSGVLWVRQIAEMGRFVFDNMDNGYRDALLLTNTDVKHLLNHKMPPEYVPRYKDGTMIIFPSGLSHRVEINETTKDRLSLSFNISYG